MAAHLRSRQRPARVHPLRVGLRSRALLLQLSSHLHRPLAELVYQSPAEQAAALVLSCNPQTHGAGDVLALIEAQEAAEAPKMRGSYRRRDPKAPPPT